MKLYFDNCIWNRFAAESSAEQALVEGPNEVLFASVGFCEIAATSDPELRRALCGVVLRLCGQQGAMLAPLAEQVAAAAESLMSSGIANPPPATVEGPDWTDYLRAPDEIPAAVRTAIDDLRASGESWLSAHARLRRRFQTLEDPVPEAEAILACP